MGMLALRASNGSAAQKKNAQDSQRIYCVSKRKKPETPHVQLCGTPKERVGELQSKALHTTWEHFSLKCDQSGGTKRHQKKCGTLFKHV